MRRPRTAKPCGPVAPTLASSRRRCFASWPATETTKPGLRGEPGISRQPSRGECRAFPATCGVLTRVLFYFRTRGCGRVERPAFPAPFYPQRGQTLLDQLARIRGENAKPRLQQSGCCLTSQMTEIRPVMPGPDRTPRLMATEGRRGWPG